MRSEQILGNPKEKIFGVEILTAKEKPLKKNIFPKKRKSTTGKWKRNDLWNIKRKRKQRSQIGKERKPVKILESREKLNMENKEKAVAVSEKMIGMAIAFCVV